MQETISLALTRVKRVNAPKWEKTPINSLGLVKITSPEKAFKHTYALEEAASPLNAREHSPDALAREEASLALKGLSPFDARELSSHALAGEEAFSRVKGTKSL